MTTPLQTGVLPGRCPSRSWGREGARFPERVAAHDGTVFTAQLKEFGDRGILVMPSDISRGALAAAPARPQPRRGHSAPRRLRPAGRPHHAGAAARHGHRAGPARRLAAAAARHDGRGHDALVEAFRIGSRLLLAAGADQLVSVHGMASARMTRAERGGVCDERGRPYGFEGLRVCDASVLPGVTGISPQGTIMVFAHEITARFIEDGGPTA
jgi:hypothetical protein